MTEIETWCDWREEKERENREFLKVFAQDFKCCRPFNWRGTLMRKNTSYSKHRSYKGTHFHIRSFSSDNLSLELVFWPPPPELWCSGLGQSLAIVSGGASGVALLPNYLPAVTPPYGEYEKNIGRCFPAEFASQHLHPVSPVVAQTEKMPIVLSPFFGK